MVFPLPCCADDRELYNQIIDIWREIARPEALVMIVTTTTTTLPELQRTCFGSDDLASRLPLRHYYVKVNSL